MSTPLEVLCTCASADAEGVLLLTGSMSADTNKKYSGFLQNIRILFVKLDATNTTTPNHHYQSKPQESSNTSDRSEVFAPIDKKIGFRRFKL